MSYISLWELQKVVPRGPFGQTKLCFEPEKRPAGAFFGRIKLYFEPEKRPAGAFWADKSNPRPMPQSPGILQRGGLAGVAALPESQGGGNRGESRRHSHSLLTPVGSAYFDFCSEGLVHSKVFIN